MANVNRLNDEPHGLVLDDYLALPWLDRVGVYRSLAPADRMRLDRALKAHKNARRSKSSKAAILAQNTDLSGWLIAHLETEDLAPATRDYLMLNAGVGS